MNQVVGNGPVFVDILMNAIIPVMTTMMVTTNGILKDNFILHPFSGRLMPDTRADRSDFSYETIIGRGRLKPN